MKTSSCRGADLPAIEFIPYDVEVREITPVEWMLAGGPPIPEHHAEAWAQTQPSPIGGA